MGNVVSDLVSVRSLGIEKYMLKEMEQSANLTIRMSVHYSAIMSLFQHVLFLGSTILIIIVIFVLVAVKDEIEDPNLGLILVLSLGVTVNIIFSGWLFA